MTFPFPAYDPPPVPPVGQDTAVLAGGCFWCVEAIYLQARGVLAVRPGYCGGSAATATYAQVCGGNTGHAEAVEISHDPRQISYGGLLRLFFSVAHDPTQVNRQGADTGPQYRSAIFYADSRQQAIAAAFIRQLEAAQVFDAPVATRLEPLDVFYPAEASHHNYAARHPANPYVAATVTPKLRKLRRDHPEALRPGRQD